MTLEPAPRPARPEGANLIVIVTARDEADLIGETCDALNQAFPGARLVLADSGSRDATAAIAERAGAEVVDTASRRAGKGGSATTAARAALANPSSGSAVFLLCDGDLGGSAARLAPLVEAVERGDCDLAVATFARRVGGGFGFAVGFARWAIQSVTGRVFRAPISGQRAMRAEVLERLLPFAPGFGMETAMTIDALRAGFRLDEIEIDLEHRATERTIGGFLHRGRQLAAFARVYLSRRIGSRTP
jgi:glycosyltransferase involved in cell wall biosynthesis